MVSDWLAQNKTFELLDVDFTDHGRSGIWRGRSDGGKGRQDAALVMEREDSAKRSVLNRFLCTTCCDLVTAQGLTSAYR